MVRHVGNGKLFPRINSHGSGINPCCGLLNVAGKALVNHAAKNNPVIRPDSDSYEKEKNRSPKDEQAKPRNPLTPANSNTQDRSPFRRDISPSYRLPLSPHIPTYSWMHVLAYPEPVYPSPPFLLNRIASVGVFSLMKIASIRFGLGALANENVPPLISNSLKYGGIA